MKAVVAGMLGLAMVAMVGCSSNKDQPKASPPLDVTPVNPTPAPSPTPVPPPTVTEAPVTPAPAPVAAEKSGGSTYVVKKGDTLMGIARAKYGDASKYKKIEAANPGVSAKTLKPGQKLVIPQ